MQLPPIDVLLTWPAPNYTNPVTRGNALVVVNYIFAVLAVITVALRLYTRAVIKRWFGIDDVFIILALVGTDRCYETDVNLTFDRSLHSA
jgi:hypothetical protein